MIRYEKELSTILKIDLYCNQSIGVPWTMMERDPLAARFKHPYGQGTSPSRLHDPCADIQSRKNGPHMLVIDQDATYRQLSSLVDKHLSFRTFQ
jgi:hypothetical protein